MIHLFSAPQRRRQATFMKVLAMISLVGMTLAGSPLAGLTFGGIFYLCAKGCERKARIIDEHYGYVAKKQQRSFS